MVSSVAELPPHTITGAGIPRQSYPPDPALDEAGNTVQPPPVTVKAMPGNCRRVFTSFRSEGCPGSCVGIQADGSCLLHIVRLANEQGVDWLFKVEWDAYGEQHWVYDGPPLVAG